MKSLKPGLIVLIVIAILAGAYFIANPKRQSAISDEKSSNIKLSSLEPAYSVPEKYNEKTISPKLSVKIFLNRSKPTIF